MHQAASHRPVTAETRVSPRGICGRQSGTGTDFFLRLLVSPVNIVPCGTISIAVLSTHALPSPCSSYLLLAIVALVDRRLVDSHPGFRPAIISKYRFCIFFF
jgi:hypothetical protein